MIRLVLIFGCLVLQAAVVAGQDNRFTEILKQTQGRMVKVVGAGVGNVEGYASGTLVSADGQIISSQGVFLDGNRVQVILADGQTYEATILKRDRRLQLSLLKIEASTPNYFELGPEDYGEQGDWIAAVSNAYRVADKDEALTVMMGVISLRTSIDAKLNQRDTAYSGPLVLLDAITSNPGAAGGAVINRAGDLVGVIGKIIDSSETNTRLNYAVPRSQLAKFVNGELDKPAEVATSPKEKVNLGIKIFKLSGNSAPAYVDRVIAGGLAAKAGIKPDDLVVSINGTKIGTVKDFGKVQENLYNDQVIFVVVTRGRKVYRFVVWEPESQPKPQSDSTDQEGSQEPKQKQQQTQAESVSVRMKDTNAKETAE